MKRIYQLALVFFLIVVLFSAFGSLNESSEKFVTSSAYGQILPDDNVFVYQGSQMPDSLPSTSVKFDQGDPSMIPVDGKAGPKSMFMFTYNECKPECCDYSPYSCSGGCVCMTKDQVNFVGTRGQNNKGDKCSPDATLY